jgi:hypothetical protein
MSPPRDRLCDARVTTAGATFSCGRIYGHVQSRELPDPDRHESLGQDHPGDGRSYLLSWYGPTVLDG